MPYLIIDGNNLAKRCKHSNAYLSTSQGVKSGTISGFMLGVMHAISVARVTKREVIVAWDAGRAAWRKELYPEYKQNRKADDKEDPDFQSYVRQLIDIQDLLTAHGIRQIRINGVEADDIIAALADYIYKDDEIIIYSNDDDFLQFYEPVGRIKIYNPSKKKFVDTDMMIKKFGFADGKYVALFKSIVGDSSDNISGVPTIGKARAQAALPFITLTKDAIKVDHSHQHKGVKHATIIQANDAIVRRNMTLIDLRSGLRSELIADITDVLRAPVDDNFQEVMRIIRNYELVDIGSRFMEI